MMHLSRLPVGAGMLLLAAGASFQPAAAKPQYDVEAHMAHSRALNGCAMTAGGDDMAQDVYWLSAADRQAYADRVLNACHTEIEDYVSTSEDHVTGARSDAQIRSEAQQEVMEASYGGIDFAIDQNRQGLLQRGLSTTDFMAAPSGDALRHAGELLLHCAEASVDEEFDASTSEGDTDTRDSVAAAAMQACGDEAHDYVEAGKNETNGNWSTDLLWTAALQTLQAAANQHIDDLLAMNKDDVK